MGLTYGSCSNPTNVTQRETGRVVIEPVTFSTARSAAVGGDCEYRKIDRLFLTAIEGGVDPQGGRMASGALPAVICRAAGDKTKGFRFQKIRACIRLLEGIALQPEVQIYCAMEFLDDSVLLDGEASPAVSTEENKFYTDPLTFNSKAIRNTAVAFLDLDAVYMHEGSLGLAVYASAPIGEEAVSADVKTCAGITNAKSKYQILKKLVAGTELSDDDVAIARAIIILEYARQYSGEQKGRIDALKAWTNEQFRSFLKRIEWSISSETNESLETHALDLVRKCPFFDYRHENLEVFIFGAILDLLEKRSHSKRLIDKMVGTSDIRLLYLECVASRSGKPIDPAYMAGDIHEASDKRNISEKILAVAPGYSLKKLQNLERRIGLAKYESQAFDREYVSLRHRVLDVCQEALEKQLKASDGKVTSESVDEVLSSLTDSAMERMSTLSGSYNYRINDRETIKGAVLTLFDDCYLALDDAANPNG